MTSKLVVNTIEADTGISSVSFASSISMSSTSKFHFSNAGIDIGADTNINRPSAGVLGFNINGAEKLRIDTNGHLNTSGIVTAANFKSGVTNVHNLGVTLTGGQVDLGSNIKIGTAGVVTATSFVGSGAQLTGITQTTINSNTNNYLITGTGTANTLQGEANLTFTGSILTVTNSSGASELTLVTPSANDSGVYFNDGSNAGALTYNHSDNSMRFRVNTTEKLRIDSDGRVMIGDTDTNNAFSGGDSLVIGNTPSGTRSGITLVSNSSTDGGIYFSTGSSNQTMGQIVYNHPDNSLRFYANNSQRLRIKSDGSVAIAGDNVNISTDTAHTVDRNEKVAIKNRYVDASATEINLDTSGNLGQSLNLVSHSSSTNNFAMLTFDSGSLKSGIAGGRPNAGNWGTDLRFYTHPNATSNVHKTYERMRIDNEGAISLKYGRVNDAGHQTYRYGGRIAGTATVSVNIPVLSDGNIYWIEAFYTHHSLSYGGYLYGVYGAYSGHNGLQINNTIGSSTAGGSNVGTWSVSRGNAGQPVVVAKSAGSYGGYGFWWIHVHAGTTPNL